jgi:CheY-like chemotaxis protein
MKHRVRILVVDDDKGIRDGLFELLEAEGYEVGCAANGLEAIHYLQQQAPSLIILDLMMPVMNGWELYGRLKADPRLAEIPVCFLSASVTDLPTDAECVLSKPVPVDTLLDAVSRHAKAACA